MTVGASSGARPERVDAARNRRRILDAAARLFAQGDPRAVSMDDVARAAGVGRATLYRRYPTPGAVAEALLDEHERRLQEQLLAGPPPLGPGAPPADRLAAFYRAMVGLLEQHSSLVLGAEVGRARFATGAYGFWRSHVLALARAAGVGEPDALADVLLAPLAPEVFRYQRAAGVTIEALTAALESIAHGVLPPRVDPPRVDPVR